MLNKLPERLTYAQEKLLRLSKEKKITLLCQEYGISYTIIHDILYNNRIPTFNLMSSACHLIAPIEWLFYTDEKLPYKPQLLPKWDSKKLSKFIAQHKFDYRTIAEKYGLTELVAYNIFVSRRQYPTYDLIKKACDSTNPIEFFTCTDILPDEYYTPDRGDLVHYDGSIYVVISKQSFVNKHKKFVGCKVFSTSLKNGIPLTKTTTKGFVDPYCINTFPFFTTAFNTPVPCLIEKINIKTVQSIIRDSKKILEE